MFRLLIIFPVFIGLCIRSFPQTPVRYDVLIDEIFPDPSPVVGLPNAEFIELKNISNVSYDLNNWQIGDATGLSRIKKSFVLKPDSFVIICPMAASSEYAGFGAVLGLSGFPSLNNESDTVIIASPEGAIIHAVAYDQRWYRNDIKRTGGWSLEMIDTRNPCNGSSNWQASSDPLGGTPGKINSLAGLNKDESAPALLRSFNTDDKTTILVFDEPLDSSLASQPSNYLADELGYPVNCVLLGPLFSSVRLTWKNAMDPRIIYQLNVTNVGDCAGNSIGAMNQAPAGIALAADSTDLAINEILFNPKTDGYDYVEIYNKGKKIIDLKKVYAANRSLDGGLANIVNLSHSPFYIYPGQYMVFTENSLWVSENYLVRNPFNLIELPAIPSLPDDEGSLVLLDEQGKPLDELHYDHQWHFPLLGNEEGVALERIDYEKPTQDRDNWTSAASSAGFGTPTYQNAEFHAGQIATTAISISPALFSPDMDGYEDFCYLRFKATTPGYVGSMTIFDASGRPVRYLVQNAWLGAEASFRWDGLDDRQQALPAGIYIVYSEIFNLQGQVNHFKNLVTLARRR